MGILRDTIGSALKGGQQFNNGLNGPNVPWKRQSNQPQGSFASYSNPYSNSYNSAYSSQSGMYDGDLPPEYGAVVNNSRSRQQRYGNGVYEPRNGYSSNGGFQPLVLPQIAAGDGQPFLRGYTNELAAYGISEREFIQIVDTINVASIPSPENVIFQKGANIAGWFVPGAAGIGLMAGQVAVGLGAHFGLTSKVAKALSRANLDVMIPKGLEICIADTPTLDSEFGTCVAQMASSYDVGQAIAAAYSPATVPLDFVLPPLRQQGRNDPIAMLGHGIAARESQKKAEKAREDELKGKRRKSKNHLKWLMVRTAPPNSVTQWQQIRQQAEQAQ